MNTQRLRPASRGPVRSVAVRSLIVLSAASVATAVGIATPVHFYDGVFHNSFGSSVASIGDVTGDDVPDFVVGAEFSSAGSSLGGEAHVFDGADGTERFRVAGSVAQRYLGKRAWPAGDFDGDGVPDMLLAAPGDGNVTRGPGYVIVASGVDGTELFRATGNSNTGYFGTAAAVIEDLTGDGVADVIVGEPGDFGAGVVRVHSGADGSVVGGRAVVGEGSDDRWGRAIAVVGDIDGDAVDDYAVGSEAVAVGGGRKFAGRVSIYSGADGSEIFRQTGRAGTARGAPFADAFGASIANLGDQDGDGVADFAVGAPGASSGGVVTVFSGGKRDRRDKTGLKRQVLWVVSGAAGSGIGRVVASAGDLDGDGRAELIATGQDVVAVYAQGPKGTGVLLAEFTGADGNDVGMAAAGAGDLDGDQRPEILVGAGAGGRAWALRLEALEFGPLTFSPLKLGSPLVRAAAGERAKGALSLTARGSKLTLQVVAVRLPSDGAYSVHLENGPGTGVFDQIAAVTATKGKIRYELTGSGEIPQDLSVRAIGELGGRRLELRDGAGTVVLEAVIPYLTPAPNERLSGVFAPPDGSPFPAASGRIAGSYSGASGRSKLDISVSGVPRETPVRLWVETFPTSGLFEDAGPLALGRLKAVSAKGDPLPGGVPRVIDLARLELRLRDDRGNDLLVFVPPTPTIALPDYTVPKVELGVTGAYLRPRCDVRNRGSGRAGPVNLRATLSFPGTQASPIVITTRTTLGFAPGETQEDLALGFELCPLGGTPNVHVHVTVDPSAVAGSYGEYLEDRERNNVTCTEFLLVNGRYEATTSAEPCPE